MSVVFLYTRDKGLKGDGLELVEELPEGIKNSVVVLDVDTVGLSSLPDLLEDGNLIVAITGKSLPGYTMKLMSLGFYDVLLKPLDLGEMGKVVERAKGELYQREEIIPVVYNHENLSEELCKELCSIIGNPEGKMKKVLKTVGKVAPLEVPVLITGETGVGKELFAKALWKLSKRWKGPFVAINCSAIPMELLEAELFGYERGAFTGAVSTKEGLIESAKGGVLFLDEIGDLPLPMQSKLLRVLQEKRLRRLGGTKEIPCDFRLVCATNRDLKALIKEGLFREDLYYRISAVHVHIPPLRERREDIPILMNCIIEKVSGEMGKRVKGYSRGFLEKVLNYPWPGNVRELENTLRRAIALTDAGVLKEKDLDLAPQEQEEKMEGLEDLIRREVKRLLEEGQGDIYHKLLKRISTLIVEEAYHLLGRNQSKTAKALGINRITLRKFLNYSNL
ncbi:MAG: sigma-54 interaction domain-containing protein [Aquificaceae bacterium]